MPIIKLLYNEIEAVKYALQLKEFKYCACFRIQSILNKYFDSNTKEYIKNLSEMAEIIIKGKFKYS